jgi:hypothetical protein
LRQVKIDLANLVIRLNSSKFQGFGDADLLIAGRGEYLIPSAILTAC